MFFDILLQNGEVAQLVELCAEDAGVGSSILSLTTFLFFRHLVNKGCVNFKTFIIKLPDFENESLNFAFLIGYYDGDGNAESTVLNSGNKTFLNQIKKKYGLQYNVKKKSENLYCLTMGADFKRKLIKNFPNCMERKKGCYAGDKRNKLNGINPNTIPRNYRLKFEITKEHLEYLISKYPYTKIGEMYGVSGNAIKKRAKKLEIQLKNRRGYWTGK